MLEDKRRHMEQALILRESIRDLCSKMASGEEGIGHYSLHRLAILAKMYLDELDARGWE